MPITVECAGCAKKYRVGDDKAGGLIRCKECGTKIGIPDDEDDFEVRRPVKTKAKRKKSSGGSTGLIIGLAAGCFALLGAIVVGVVMLTSGGSAKAPVAENPAAIPAPAAAVPAGDPVPVTPPALPPESAPVASVAAPKWSVVVDVPKSPVAWPNSPPTVDDLRGALDKLLVPSTDSPIAVTGLDKRQLVCRVINLATGERVGKFYDPSPGTNITSQHFAIHPEGTLLATEGKFEKNKPRAVEIWDVKQGKLGLTFPAGTAGCIMKWLDFGPNGELLLIESGKFENERGVRLSMFDPATGTRIRQFALLGDYETNPFAMSASRRFLAIVHRHPALLAIYDLTLGTVAGKIPGSEFGGGSAAVSGVRFSSNGAELAVLAMSDNPSITVFDVASGERTSQVNFISDFSSVSVSTALTTTPGLQWLSDDSGWLVAGNLIVDRATRRVIWKVQTEANEYGLENLRMRFPTPAGIWSVDGEDDAGKLTLIPAPWVAGRELLAKQSDEANLMRPGAAVSIQVEIGDVRFAEKEAAAKSLASAMTARLKGSELKTADGQNVVLRITYAETEGKTLQEFKQDPNPKGKRPETALGNATGRSVEATNAVLDLALTDADGRTVYWSHHHIADPSLISMVGEPTKEAIRDHLFQRLLLSLKSLPMPYYLTAEADSPQLPVLHRVPRW